MVELKTCGITLIANINQIKANLKQLETVMEYLLPFKEATELTCADQYPTLSLIVPLFNRILDHVDVWMRTKTTPGDRLHNSVIATKAKIAHYYNTSSDCYTIATVLDPRFNLYYYQDDTNDQVSYLDVKSLVQNHFNDFYKPTSIPSAVSLGTSNSTLASKIFKIRKFSHDEEIEQYFKEPVLEVDKTTDVLQWWKGASKKYPNLSRIARDYLAIPGPSASSERLFSTATDVLTDNRQSLSAPTIQAVQCLKSWM